MDLFWSFFFFLGVSVFLSRFRLSFTAVKFVPYVSLTNLQLTREISNGKVCLRNLNHISKPMIVHMTHVSVYTILNPESFSLSEGRLDQIIQGPS